MHRSAFSPGLSRNPHIQKISYCPPSLSPSSAAARPVRWRWSHHSELCVGHCRYSYTATLYHLSHTQLASIYTTNTIRSHTTRLLSPPVYAAAERGGSRSRCRWIQAISDSSLGRQWRQLASKEEGLCMLPIRRPPVSREAPRMHASSRPLGWCQGLVSLSLGQERRKSLAG
jgi:hypothetical protein